MSRALRVVEPGLLTLVQDAGRPGLAHLGVPRSGWLDDRAARLANRLVGNPEGAAVLECLRGGLAVEPLSATTVAVTGAECSVLLGRRPAAHHAAVSAPARALLRLGPTRAGARCYVAVAGGVDVPPVLGSRATDTLSRLGPAPLQPGAVLPVGPAAGPPSQVEAPPAPSPGGGLGLHAGPRVDWFAEGALEVLAESAYTVAADSDRVALRLSGPPLTRARGGELPSEGIVLGAVQVPADGRPLIFLNDHPTTGGYPVVAVVDRADVGRCAQLLPGDPVRFRLRGPRRRPGPG